MVISNLLTFIQLKNEIDESLFIFCYGLADVEYWVKKKWFLSMQLINYLPPIINELSNSLFSFWI